MKNGNEAQKDEDDQNKSFNFPSEPFGRVNDLYRALSNGIDSSYADTVEDYDFTVKEVKILIRNEWLNDKIINAYFSLIEKHNSDVFTFSSYFYYILVRDGYEKVSKWTKKTNIFDYKYILIPIHLKNHWVFVTIDIKNHGIEYYDSLGGYNNEVVRNIAKYIEKEQARKLDFVKYYFPYKYSAPQQTNGYDCGVFVCMYARYRSEGSRNFFLGQMRQFRLKILHEILAKRIIYDLDHKFSP